MSWEVGFDSRWRRWIGYGVPAMCDHPGCGVEIDRGLSYVCCEQQPYGGEGCGLFFCEKHRDFSGRCARCQAGCEPFDPTPDVAAWRNHLLTDPTWQQWRDENPDEVGRLVSSGGNL